MTDDHADLSAPRHTRLGVIGLVALLHILAVFALIRAFAPDFSQQVTQSVVSAFTVTVTAPEPTPTPPPAKAPEPAGKAAPIGKKATPRATAAPKARIAISPSPAPAVAGKGSDDSSGARDRGTGSGAGGLGNGTGSGNGGNGSGGGATAKAVKIAGDINSTRDYPADSRELRLGHEVIVYMTVGTDGRARNCRVQKPSPDPRADTITCTLAEQRFRFRPAVDAAGNPVEAIYGWRQRWFHPNERN